MRRFHNVFYIGAAGLLGFLVQIVIHAVVEIAYINVLVRNYDRWRLGLNWEQLVAVHHVAALTLLVAGIGVGLWLGVRWWHRIYENAR